MKNTPFRQHIGKLGECYESALSHYNTSKTGNVADAEAVLLHSGSEDHYYADDRHIAFQAFGHFLHCIAVNRPDQFVLLQPGQTPTYFQVVPSDFWYEQDIEVATCWSEQFELVRLQQISELVPLLPKVSIAYLGPNPDLALTLNIDPKLANPKSLLNYLDFQRAYKTDYEIEQLKAANKLALRGHTAARKCFLEGATEYDIHMAFLQTCNMLEEESPYTNIVALDEKSAILHYQNKRRNLLKDSQVLLIDAGCRINGYGSDITRTSVKEDTDPLFCSILRAMEKLELDLVNKVKPGIAYPLLHDVALDAIADILLEHNICNGSASQLIEQEIPQLFMPHGVGHLLGIQVHDVGGHQKDVEGNSLAAPSHSPALRNTRLLEENMVFTIEPGFYFIPMLLEPERETAKGKCINWRLIDRLYPCGGIRVEDNICVTKDGVENLTRQFE